MQATDSRKIYLVLFPPDRKARVREALNAGLSSLPGAASKPRPVISVIVASEPTHPQMN
jgi:hypothetical protein